MHQLTSHSVSFPGFTVSLHFKAPEMLVLEWYTENKEYELSFGFEFWLYHFFYQNNPCAIFISLYITSSVLGHQEITLISQGDFKDTGKSVYNVFGRWTGKYNNIT